MTAPVRNPTYNGPMPRPLRAAIGFRVHSGWAAAVSVGGSLKAPRVIDRRRIEIYDKDVRGAKQPFHGAEPMPFPAAKKYLEKCTESTQALANGALESLTSDIQSTGHDAVATGLLLASARPLPDLKAILASHALIHTAEGEFFRDAIRRACENCRLPVHGIKEKVAWTQATEELGIAADELCDRISSAGRILGPPWTMDEKLSMLAAWVALARR